MNLDRDLDTTRIVRSWLRRDEHESADRVLDNVLDLLDTTPQHRSWPVRRFADMNSFAKLAIAAAVLIAVAFVGINLLPRAGRDVGGPAPSPSPAASASPSLSPSPSLAPEPTPVEGAIPPAGTLAVGRHVFSQNGVDFSLEIASPDWSSSGISVAPDGGNLTKGVVGLGSPGSAWILSWSIDGVFSDPCDHVAAPPAGPTTADLAAAVAKIPGLELLTGPTDLTVGGKATKFVSVKVPEDLPCAPSQFRLWYDDVRCGADYPCHRWATVAGETHQIWIIDADGTRVWIEAETYPASPPELAAEVRAIVESIKFE